jgi:hypothetical protein
MADGGGTRPEFERGRGFWWPKAVVQARGAVGRGVALEREAGEEWVTEERTTFQARFETSGRWRGREGKREGEGRGVRPWECRARVAGQKQRGGTDRWAATQCRAVVPLTGGSSLLAVRGRERRARRRVWAGPIRKRSGQVWMNSTGLQLFELV